MIWVQPVAALLLGSWAGVMAHLGWGNYHDGVRPLLAEQAAGNLSREELTAMAGESNRPFIFGALGLSVMAGLPLAHWAWLPAEALGFRSRRVLTAALGGAAWGLLAWLIIWAARIGAGLLPVPLLPAFEKAALGVLAGGIFTPALAAGHRYGNRWAYVGLLFSAGAAAVGYLFSTAVVVSLAAAMAAGGLLFFVLLFRELSGAEPLEGLPVTERRVPTWAILVQGAILAFAVRAGVFGWSTADGVAAAQGWWLAGAAVALTLVPAFAPQWSAALASTGVAQLAGLGLSILAGFLAPSILWAPVLGVVASLLEMKLLPYAVRLPQLREAGESVRWALGKTAQAAVLAGAVWGAADLLPAGLGVAIVIGTTVLNDLLPAGLWRTAAPAWGLLLAGLLASAWQMLGGF